MTPAKPILFAGLSCLAMLAPAACQRLEAPASPTQETPAPAAPAATPEEAALWLDFRDAEARRMLDTPAPLRKGAGLGLARLENGAPAPIGPADRAAWETIGQRLAGRFGAVTPIAPIAAEIAAEAAPNPEPPLASLRRAAAMQRLDYVLIYRTHPRQGRERPARAEAALLDVRTGFLLASLQAEAGETGAADAAQALTALGPHLEDLARRMDVAAMRESPALPPP